MFWAFHVISNCGSDHYLVTAKLVYPFRHLNHNNWKSHEKPKTQEIHQYNLHLLQQESIRQLYINRLNEKLTNLQKMKMLTSKTSALLKQFMKQHLRL